MFASATQLRLSAPLLLIRCDAFGEPKINDLDFEVLETFQNEDGSRVASLWRVTGKNNGMMGTVPDQQPISLTGTAIWSVREDGKLLHNRVERAAWETFLNLTSKKH